MVLKRLYHRLRGRRELYQIYVNVFYSTPQRCLKYHGDIVAKESEVPNLSHCDFELLAFSVSEITDYKEKKQRMKEVAEREVERRELFHAAVESLESENYEKALDLFKRSLKLDIFLAEIEEFQNEYGASVPREVRKKLKDLFVLYYKEKFGQKRYERLPEKMREERKKAGVAKIKDLFD